MDRILIVGAGLSGAVIARVLAESGHACLVIEERPHAGGNCHTQTDERTGIIVHRHGPHIFHTDDEEVWRFVQRFCTMRPYRHRVITQHGGRVYTLPINLLTINQFFGTAMNPGEAQRFIAAEAEPCMAPANFEEQALSMIGRRLYEAFFRDYTRKQWGLDPTALPASVLKRLPLRFSYEDSYFTHRHQAIPEDGYTPMIAAMLDHPAIELRFGTPFVRERFPARHVVYSGPLDRYFDHAAGRLAYRTLDFETVYAPGDVQGAAVLNYADAAIPYTRITEHRHFAPWRAPRGESILSVEYSRDCGPTDLPYYPIRLAADEARLAAYVALGRGTSGVTFAGRLGTYSYIDMDVAVRRAIDTAQAAGAALSQGAAPCAFYHPPL
ncbi:UDP-galactopyranose/dTDP-fucopyranose mutase family protein [Aureimonas frigidaquae]|uniref:UDP-galactopyranose mutase C-terminal domain-containing protein n=1 Tax=Aureimonas frigidaquae TaxID=424757 RepID=A0A0P0Z161_9HYPH|nr:FAD-dependent oxidoreductase [Aureimonas frigidaquae]BAT27626.1 hypothetical protein [Aureimonas frigidaquae]